MSKERTGCSSARPAGTMEFRGRPTPPQTLRGSGWPSPSPRFTSSGSKTMRGTPLIPTTSPSPEQPLQASSSTGDFRHEKLPQDVIVVAGLNNLIKNQTVDQIMEEVEAFYPPQFKWFPTDGPCPYPSNKLNLNDEFE